MKRYIINIIKPLLLLLLMVHVVWAAYAGSVRLNNYTDKTLIILVQVEDYYGYQQWREIGEVPPRSYVVVPDIPNGTVIGAQSKDKSIVYKTVTVSYGSGNYYEVDYR
jgi:hypothetical protein